MLLLGSILFLGMLLMCTAGGQSRPAEKGEPAAPSGALSVSSSGAVPGDLEGELEGLLCQIKGAGRVQVALRYGSSSRAEYAYDESSSSSSGENASSRDTERRLAEIDGQPVLLSTSNPQVTGLVVVAEGAGDPLVKERLYQALSSLFGINAVQIAIIEAEGSGDYEDQ
ncbi:MAG: hypothetical protein Q4B50_06795 [Bacillota bacterium]|nr:hypothetical protein [Bacillota bacterium]